MFQTRNRGLWQLSLALVLVACAAIPSLARDEDLADDLSRLMSLGDIPGVSVAIVRDNSVVWSDAQGVRDQRAGGPVDQQTVFEAASLSKTVFAYMVLRLADRGVLDLDTPLATYARYPRLEGDPRHRIVTARMCLNHTTGLPNWGTRFLAEPGTRFTYSGEGIRYLRRTVEEITGRSLEDLTRREVFTPLGMDRSSYLWRVDYASNHATGHDNRGVPQPRRECPEGSAAASLHTTAGDYARFLQACLTGEGLSDIMADQMHGLQIHAAFSGTSVSGGRLGWSLGWGVMSDKQGDLIWQWGDNGDAVALAVGCPEQGCGIVYFANSATGLSVAHELIARVLPQRPIFLDALGYQRYDAPERVQWFEAAAQRAASAGRLDAAADLLETLIQLRPDHPWASQRLHEIRVHQAARDVRDGDHG